MKLRGYAMNEKGMQALKEYQRKLAAGEVKRTIYRNPLEKLQDNPTSLRLAINANCFDCGGGEEPNWRNRIKFCQILNCPLHKVRPYSKGITDDDCLEWVESEAKS